MHIWFSSTSASSTPYRQSRRRSRPLCCCYYFNLYGKLGITTKQQTVSCKLYSVKRVLPCLLVPTSILAHGYRDLQCREDGQQTEKHGRRRRLSCEKPHSVSKRCLWASRAQWMNGWLSTIQSSVCFTDEGRGGGLPFVDDQSRDR